MKNRFLFIMAVSAMALPLTAAAQRNGVGEVSVGITAGTLGGLTLRTNVGEWNYTLGIDCAVVTSNRNSLVVGLDYTKRQTYSFDYRALRNIDRYTLSFGCSYPLLHDRGYNFVVGLGWNVLGGYESPHNTHGRFVYGGSCDLLLTYYLSDYIALIGKVAEQCVFHTDKTFETRLSVGIKCVW